VAGHHLEGVIDDPLLVGPMVPGKDAAVAGVPAFRSYSESRWLAALALLATVLSLGAAFLSAQRQDWTYDEGDHLAYSRRLLGTGETERRSYLQFNSKTPAAVPNVLALNHASRYLEGPEPQRRKLAARLPTILWFALLLATVWAVARRIAGLPAAHLALLLTALEPNLVANASIVTVDVAFTLTAALSLVAAFALAERPGLARSLILGLALGAAFVTKFSAFLLLPLVLLATLLVLRGLPPPERRRAAGMLALWFGVAAVVAGIVLCAGYGWAGVGAPLSSRTWRGEPMQTLAGLAPWLRSPAPIDFLTGVDITTAQERSKEWPVLVLGEIHHPVWYYFPLQWALKTPIALALAQLAGLWALLRDRPRSVPGLFAGLSLLAFAAYFLVAFRAQIGYRFALIPVFLACLLAGIGLARLRHRAAVATALLVLAAAEQVPYLGNHLAFTNLVVWPKRHAYRLLGDSSIDYRQNEDQAQAWVDSQRGARLDPVHILPGRNVFGITRLYSPEHDWVRRHLEPRAHFRYSHVVFDVDAETFHAFLQAERRLASGADDERLCHPPDASPVLPGGELSVAPPAGPGRVVLVCIEAPQATALVLRGQEGFAGFGMPEERRKRWSSTGPGQVAWFWAEPGTHAILLVALKGSFRGRIEGDPGVSVRARPVQLEKSGYLPGMEPSPPQP